MNTCSQCKYAALCVAGLVLGKRAGYCGDCTVSVRPVCHSARIYKCACGQLWDVAFTDNDVGVQALLSRASDVDLWGQRWFGSMNCCAKCRDGFRGDRGHLVLVELCGVCGCASLMPGDVFESSVPEVRLVSVREWTSRRARGLAGRRK